MEGINEDLTDFLLLHLHKKEHSQYVKWLQKLESITEGYVRSYANNLTFATVKEHSIKTGFVLPPPLHELIVFL
ncbi:hypothetical protein QJS10_CPB15g01455 [Acorus calamus]|uniref:PH domain-containing protein n=1 Tax=Acorus calamus TaxID=4465 RepID=A0AAV9D9B0_ACOCL|nr:hypothetical protein QJS10_CPB15g01455 [Acorus calamus]